MINRQTTMKGQTEMIGLVIVVVILLVGALFYVGFCMGNKIPQKNVALEVSYVSNLLYSIVNVQVCDGKSSFDESLIACYKQQDFCDKEACGYVTGELKKIMDSVEYKEPKKYSIWIESDGNIKSLVNNCKSGTKTDIRLSRDNDQVYEVSLQLC